MVALLAVTGCKKDLDINNDPYLPIDASPKLLLPAGIAASAAKIGGDVQNIGSFWSQHFTQNNTSSQYRSLDQYIVGISDFNTIWSNVYGGGLKDLDIVMSKTQASGEWNYYIAASIMSVFDYHILNDIYGQLPYSEGLKGGENPNPHWEDGKVVNTKLIAQLDAAIAKEAAATAAPAMGNEDFVFQGNIAEWMKFAKTLKLKILMRDFTANQAAIQTMLTAGGFLDTHDAKMTGFADSETKSNPLYEYDRRKLNTSSNIKASNTLLNYLKLNDDPRIPIFFEKAVVTGSPTPWYEYVGLDQGNFNVTGIQTNQTSRAVLAATDPVYFSSIAETKFLLAEAYARLGNAANAKINYDLGVTAAFTRWGLSAAPLIAPGGKYVFIPGTTDQMIKQIIVQKWVAAVRCQGWDSWFDQNRTGYPTLSPVPAGDPAYVTGNLTVSVTSSLLAGEIPRRLLIPKISSDANPNTPKAVAINTKMWWHKQ